MRSYSTSQSLFMVNYLFVYSCDSSNYLDQVAEEINDTLQESGQVIISELSKTFTLSTDFLLEVKLYMYR